MRTNRTSCLLIILVFSLNLFAQRGNLRVMFYNVENLFDTINDPEKQDDEFTPMGEKHWDYFKYTKKLNNLFKVIAYSGGWVPPEIIGICEIENLNVLKDLVNKTPLYKYPYQIAHYESPDQRGIDVACLYNSDQLSVLYSNNLKVTDSVDFSFKTRDILHIHFKTMNNDSFHLFVNHWPSRRGGEYISQNKRILASKTLVGYINEKIKISENFIIMGDFNDEPSNQSIQLLGNSLKVRTTNMSRGNDMNHGTLKYQGSWNLFDQIIVSENFFNENSDLYIKPDGFCIVSAGFLYLRDESYAGYKPFSTYTGPVFKGGYSDHLPVYVDILYKR